MEDYTLLYPIQICPKLQENLGDYESGTKNMRYVYRRFESVTKIAGEAAIIFKFLIIS